MDVVADDDGGKHDATMVVDESVGEGRTFGALKELLRETTELRVEHDQAADAVAHTATQLETEVVRVRDALRAAVSANDTLRVRSLMLAARDVLQSRTREAHQELSHAQESVRKHVVRLERAARAPFRAPDSKAVWDPHALDDRAAELDAAVARHLVRVGRADAASALATDGGAAFPTVLCAAVAEMDALATSLANHDATGPLEWCRRQRHALASAGSDLELVLCSLRFAHVVTTKPNSQQSPAAAALALFRTDIQPLVRNDWPCSICDSNTATHRPCRVLHGERHQLLAKRLLGMVAFCSRPNTSPYADLASPTRWETARSQFIQCYCRVLGLSTQSPLSTAVLAGTLALPTIAKMSNVLAARANLEWSQADEFPVELPLLPSMHFHSVFACPVSKEQTTETNPPMRLWCGHVICRECVGRLSKGYPAQRFKCPYCPVETLAWQPCRVLI